MEADGFEVLLDDRDERPGVKFKDCDLLGIPLRVVIGARTLEKGQAEVKERGAQDPDFVPLAELTAYLKQRIAEKM
jgi:prolyl-tRNA synthetase